MIPSPTSIRTHAAISLFTPRANAAASRVAMNKRLARQRLCGMTPLPGGELRLSEIEQVSENDQQALPCDQGGDGFTERRLRGGFVRLEASAVVLDWVGGKNPARLLRKVGPWMPVYFDDAVLG